jgi:hypothetical protein
MRALRAQSAGAPIPLHRTMNSSCPVYTGHPGGSTCQSSNGQNPTATMTWQGAPDCPVCTGLSGAPSNRELPATATFGGWGYKYPNHPTIHCHPSFPTSQPLTRARHSNLDTYKEIKSSPIPLKPLVTSERDLQCSFELLRLDRILSFSLALVINTQL